jgi:ABC-type nitrate/sulfonate/bicarbonate transport system permease component
MKKTIIGGSSIIFLILIWQIYALYVDNIYILPGPIEAGKAFVEIMLDQQTYIIIITTMIRLLIALTISFISGIILGIFSGNYPIIDDFLHPIVSTLRSLPIASIIVIILILVGHQSSLYIITFLMIFPIMYEATKSGVKNIDTSIKHAISLETNTKWTIMTQIQFPLALPYIRTALFQSIGLGFKVIVMAEFIAQSNTGIGRALYNGSISIEYASVFAWTIIIIILVIIIEKILHYFKDKQPIH